MASEQPPKRPSSAHSVSAGDRAQSTPGSKDAISSRKDWWITMIVRDVPIGCIPGMTGSTISIGDYTIGAPDHFPPGSVQPGDFVSACPSPAYTLGGWGDYLIPTARVTDYDQIELKVFNFGPVTTDSISCNWHLIIRTTEKISYDAIFL